MDREVWDGELPSGEREEVGVGRAGEGGAYASDLVHIPSDETTCNSDPTCESWAAALNDLLIHVLYFCSIFKC